MISLPLFRHLRIYVRAEALVAEIRLKLIARKLLLGACGAGIGLIGFVMLNVAGYQALEQMFGPVWTSLGIAVVDFIVGGVIFAVALLSRPGPEMKLAESVRQTALDAVESEFHGSSSAGGVLSGPLETAATHLLVSSLGSIIGSLRRKPGQKAAGTEP